MSEINFKSKRSECVGALGPFSAAGVSIERYDVRQEIRIQAMVVSGADMHLAPCIVSIPSDPIILDAVLDKLVALRKKM